MTCEDARKLLLVVVPAVVAVGWLSGVLEEVLLVCMLAWMYNDLGGSEYHWALKNLLVSVGYGVFFSLALRITTGVNHTITTKGYHWIVIITLVMFATQHIADVKDVEGDRLRGRRTAPVALGEEVCRWSIAVGVVLSSGLCPALFHLGMASHCIMICLGSLVAGRTVVRTVYVQSPFRDID
jgi:4-hydroxybenzoate polyprenyltransferase